MITGAGISPATVTGIEMVHQSRRYALTVGGDTLSERDRNLGIPSSITLRIKTGTADTAAGEHTVTIADSRVPARTPGNTNLYGDYPNPQPVVDPIEFTLYTTTGTGDPDVTPRVTVAPPDRSKSTTLPTYKIDELYTVTGGADTALLVYEVLEGPGTLYLGEYDEPTGTHD